MEEKVGLTDEQQRKLPRWALGYVRKLEVDLRDAKAQLELLSGPVLRRPGAVTRGHWMVEEYNVVKPGEPVYFWTGPDNMDYIEVRHSNDHRDEAVMVRGGMTTLLVQAQASNGLIVEPGYLPSYTRRLDLMMRARSREARVPFGRKS